MKSQASFGGAFLKPVVQLKEINPNRRSAINRRGGQPLPDSQQREQSQPGLLLPPANSHLNKARCGAEKPETFGG